MPMKIAVAGAGSIGGSLGARLALAGEDVTFIARGANLQAINARGFRLIEEDGTEQVARNVQPLQVEPGKFNYRLVRGELEFDDYGTIEAHGRIDMGPVSVVPYTLLPPVG